MAIFCVSCNMFMGGIRTCHYCHKPVCADCRASDTLCKDCFLEVNAENLVGEYNNEKSITAIVNIDDY